LIQLKQDCRGTFVGYGVAIGLMISWNDGRDLKIIDCVDKWHVEKDDELDGSFENLREIQDLLAAGKSSRCPCCGQPFNYRRDDVSIELIRL